MVARKSDDVLNQVHLWTSLGLVVSSANSNYQNHKLRLKVPANNIRRCETNKKSPYAPTTFKSLKISIDITKIKLQVLKLCSFHSCKTINIGALQVSYSMLLLSFDACLYAVIISLFVESSLSQSCLLKII